MKKGLFFFGALTLLLSCSYDQSQEITATEKEEISIPVRVTAIENKLVKETKSYYGTLKFQQSANIIAEQPGIVTNLNAIPGKNVKKDEVIVTYPPANHHLQVDQALIEIEKLRTDFERQKELFEAGAVSKISVDELKTQLEVQEKMLEQLQQVGIVRAPFNGIITQLHTSFGQEVHPGYPLLSMAATSRLKVDFFVSTREIDEIALGANAYFTHNDKQFSGTVVKKEIEVDDQKKGIRVTAGFENSHISFVGNTVDVTVETGSSSNGIWIPSGCFRRQGSLYTVFVAKNNRASKRTIEIMKRDEEKALVKSGLQEGEQLIVSGMDKLEENTTIKIVEKQ